MKVDKIGKGIYLPKEKWGSSSIQESKLIAGEVTATAAKPVTCLHFFLFARAWCMTWREVATWISYAERMTSLTPDHVCYISIFFAFKYPPLFDILFFFIDVTETWQSHPSLLQVTTAITLPLTNISRVPNRIIQPQAKLSFRGTRINQVRIGAKARASASML